VGKDVALDNEKLVSHQSHVAGIDVTYFQLIGFLEILGHIDWVMVEFS
jgi:hypothetical protein